jgi:hypothetical protein
MVFLVAAIALVLINALVNKTARSHILQYVCKNWCLLVFIGLATIINVIYFLLYQDKKFLISSLCFIFNFLVIIVFFAIKKDKKFFGTVKLVLVANIAIQLLIYIVGLGRFHPHDTFRYMGTLNDPNQLAFYVFLAMLFIYVINFLYKDLRRRYDWAVWIAGTIIIALLASSTGVLLGLVVFFAAVVVVNRKNIIARIRKTMPIPLMISCAIFVVLLGIGGIVVLEKTGVDIPIIGRLQDKAEESNGANIFEGRSIDTIVYYPQNLLYGAGEGGVGRFTKQKLPGYEIHSSLIALLFYYGIIPFIFLIKWLWDITKKIDIRIKIAFLAILIESFTLVNYRQPLLWIFLVLPIALRAPSKPAKKS